VAIHFHRACKFREVAGCFGHKVTNTEFYRRVRGVDLVGFNFARFFVMRGRGRSRAEDEEWE
jgi:hypothetical protein